MSDTGKSQCVSAATFRQHEKVMDERAKHTNQQLKTHVIQIEEVKSMCNDIKRQLGEHAKTTKEEFTDMKNALRDRDDEHRWDRFWGKCVVGCVFVIALGQYPGLAQTASALFRLFGGSH